MPHRAFAKRDLKDSIRFKGLGGLVANIRQKHTRFKTQHTLQSNTPALCVLDQQMVPRHPDLEVAAEYERLVFYYSPVVLSVPRDYSYSVLSARRVQFAAVVRHIASNYCVMCPGNCPSALDTNL